MKKIFFFMTAIAIGFFCACSNDGGSGGGSSWDDEISAPKLRVFGATSSSMKLSWNSVDGASCYNVEYNDGYGWTSEGAIYTTEYTISGLEGYTTYSFRVRAVGKNNTSGWSSAVSGKTLIGKPFVQARKSGTTVTVIISPVKGATYYGVSYGTTSDFRSAKFYKTAYPESESVVEVSISGLTKGKTYYFFVVPFSNSTAGAEYTSISVSL